MLESTLPKRSRHFMTNPARDNGANGLARHLRWFSMDVLELLSLDVEDIPDQQSRSEEFFRKMNPKVLFHRFYGNSDLPMLAISSPI